jgi:cytochrome o ubiquinol oxidase operon protein cyoD
MHGNTPASLLADGDHHDGASHGTVQSYLTGFALSVILTALPFALVMAGFRAAVAIPVALALGVAQMVVHLVYFLHMDRASSRSWNMAAFVFTLIILLIVVVGSLWVMYHLNVNMMPGMMPSD